MIIFSNRFRASSFLCVAVLVSLCHWASATELRLHFHQNGRGCVVNDGIAFKVDASGEIAQISGFQHLQGCYHSGTSIYLLATNRLFRSGDDGQTWGDVTSSFTSEELHFSSVGGRNARHFWVLGHPPDLTDNTWFFVTLDGGATWSSSRLDRGWNSAIGFWDEHTGLLATHQNLFRTRDGGLTWAILEAPFSAWQVSTIPAALLLTAPHEALIFNGAGEVLSTSDGGRIWERLPPSPELEGLRVDKAHLAGNAIWLVADKVTQGAAGFQSEQIVLTSTDLGKTWRRFEPSEGVSAFYFPSKQKGWWVHSKNSRWDLLRSDNRGQDWSLVGSARKGTPSAPLLPRGPKSEPPQRP